MLRRLRQAEPGAGCEQILGAQVQVAVLVKKPVARAAEHLLAMPTRAIPEGLACRPSPYALRCPLPRRPSGGGTPSPHIPVRARVVMTGACLDLDDFPLGMSPASLNSVAFIRPPILSFVSGCPSTVWLNPSVASSTSIQVCWEDSADHRLRGRARAERGGTRGLNVLGGVQTCSIGGVSGGVSRPITCRFAGCSNLVSAFLSSLAPRYSA